MEWRRSAVRIDGGACPSALEVRFRRTQSGANGSSGSGAGYRSSPGGGAYGGGLRRMRVAALALRSGDDAGEGSILGSVLTV